MTTLANPSKQGGRVRVSTGTLTYASQSAASYSFDSKVYLPVGATVVGIRESTSVTTGSATVSYGITGTTAKYKALAAVTATTLANVSIPHAAVLATPLTAQEEILVTNAAAALPASGTLKVIIEYVVD